MSDLTATNCGCNNSCGNNNCGNGIFGNSCIWIILLLFCGGGCGNNNGCGLLGSNNGCGGNDCCEWLIWILLLSCPASAVAITAAVTVAAATNADFPGAPGA